jgi:filamentous hemagglutinin
MYKADGKTDIEDNPGNGMHTQFGYDSRGFVSLTNTYRLSSAQPYSKRDYYRDTRDRIYAWKKGTYATINPLENGRGDRYTYDAEGQLTAASYQALTPNTTPTGAQRTESFIYDQLGSRKGVNTIAGRGTITFYRRDNGLNQYLPSGTFLNHYDDEFAPNAPGLANGVQMQDGAHSVVFNALNQPIWMQSAATPPGTLMWVGHDPLGRCVKRWTSASPDPLTNPATYFYYDGWNMIQEGPNAATADRIYAHGNRIDEIVASQAGGAWYYHHYDARGHCILITNASGGLVEQYDYNAFGKPYFYNGSGTALPNGSAIGNRFLFTGRELIKDIGIYDFRNRIYEPELARFLQPDPKQFEAGDYNLYRYCHNDPINKNDPFGLDSPEWMRAAIPGQIEWDAAVANYQAGNYGTAAAFAGASAAQGVLGVISWGASTRANAPIQAVRTAAMEANAARNLVSLNRQLASQEIAGGHAFAAHAAEFGFRTRAQMAAHIEKVMANPTATRSLSGGRTAFWDKATQSVVIRNPSAADGGTAFIPKEGEKYFRNLR